MLLEQLVRLLYDIIEIGAGLVLVAIFFFGIMSIVAGFPIIGLLMAGGAIWFVASALKNRE